MSVLDLGDVGEFCREPGDALQRGAIGECELAGRRGVGTVAKIVVVAEVCGVDEICGIDQIAGEVDRGCVRVDGTGVVQVMYLW